MLSSVQTVLVTGGSGFVGCNLVHWLLQSGHRVKVLDNLSRPGSELNFKWLASLGHSDRLSFVKGDVRDAAAVEEAMQGVNAVFHLAAQVAVTTSIVDPLHDLEVNVLGTFNVLESARKLHNHPLVVFASTNKVYGIMEDIAVQELDTRYNYVDLTYGISEQQPLDFHSPYGCSKGSADQYVRDYARIYGLPTVILRLSCIYGPHQFGNEDQGWIAHFVITALKQGRITIYGDGKQVRDVLYISDLLDLLELILNNRAAVAGQVFNVGGGKENTISIWNEFGLLLSSFIGHDIEVQYDSWRPGDQKIYVSDIRKVERILGWHPKVSIEKGISKLLEWLKGQGIAP